MLTLTRDQREASLSGSDPGLSTRWESGYVETLVHQGFVRWTSKEAALVLGETAFPGQTRHLKPAGQEHIKVLAEMMRRDLWRPFDKLDFARLPDGMLVLVNGHHRLTAQELAQRSIEWAVVIHARRTMEEVAQLYHDFDTNVRLRTQDQIIDASGLDDELGLSKKIATAVFTAVPLIATGLDPSKASRDLLTERIYGLRYSLVKEYRDAAQSLELALQPADGQLQRRVLRQGSAAVALVTFRYQPRRAESFWSLIAENSGLTRGHPCHTYVKTILANKAGSTSWLSAAWAAHAWNAYSSGKHTSYFKPGEPRPLKVIGTPFEKGRE